jgi:hypothetical protein
MDVRQLVARLTALSSLALGCQSSDPAMSGDETSSGSSDETAAYESSSSYTDGVVDSSSSSSSSDDGSTTEVPAESSSSSDDPSGTTADTSPTAEPDTYLLAMGQTHTVTAAEGVLVNDADAKEVVAAELVTDAGGSVELHADGSFTYSPAIAWWGEDGFEYTLVDAAEGETGTVRIVVHPTTITNGMVDAGQGGFVMRGEDPNGLTGSRVAGAGDVNGDGLADVLVTGTVPGGLGDDRVYVVFGKADDDPVQLGSLADDDAGFAIDSEPESPYTGRSIDGAGDVNGDGLADLVIQGDAGEFGEVPRVYVVFGKADTQTVSLADVAAGVGGFAIDGGDAPELALAYVAGAGDVDGDGLGDLIIGCNASPQSYVVFGKADTSPVSVAAVIGGEGGFVLVPENDAAYYNFSVGPAGDVDGDGLADVIVGNPAADGGASESGRIYVVFGKAGGDAVELAALDTDGTGFAIDGEQAYDWAGNSVRTAGDVDGDGLADVVIGATDVYDGGIAYAGRTYVVYGKADTESVPLQTLVDDGAGFMMTGEAEQDLFGLSVSGAGDVDGDGLADIVAGSSWPTPYGSFSGRTYVIYGDPVDPVVDLAEIRAGIGGFAAEGDAPYKNLGHRVAAAGDVDGDGFDDVILAAPGTDSGYAYVVRGGDFTLGASR